MLLIDPAAGTIPEANQAAAGFHGYERAKFKGMWVSDINELPATAIQAEMRLAEQESRDCFYFSDRLANGDIRRVEVRSGPIVLNDRHLLCSIVFDVTERWRLEEARQRQLSSLHVLNEVDAIRDIPLAEQLRAALAIGCRLLGLEYGIVSHVVGDRYEIVAQSPPLDTLRDGQVFSFGQTYCAITLSRPGVLAIRRMGESPYLVHPCYQAFKLETYIGAPIQVEGARYGPVNFSSPRAYGRVFDEGDLEFMTLIANWVGSAIKRHEAGRHLAESGLASRLSWRPNHNASRPWTSRDVSPG